MDNLCIKLKFNLDYNQLFLGYLIWCGIIKMTAPIKAVLTPLPRQVSVNIMIGCASSPNSDHSRRDSLRIAQSNLSQSSSSRAPSRVSLRGSNLSLIRTSLGSIHRNTIQATETHHKK